MKQYTPLYLKYRPQRLSELVGQEVVKRTLTNAISYNKIVHAYLFCGPRGTGKTSTARILAKSLNCEDGITVDPCNKCTSCQSITIGNSLDVIEIDAASHRKVEDAEDLINRVSLGTYGSRYKVYIIDEVHMLTDHAFNALLKTIEEPPKNVIFILATTEEHKVISTIISRCQKLDFKPIFQSELEKRIKDIASSENINIDGTVINFISKRSTGCLRDAISLLDQISVLQIDEKPINPTEVFTLFGTIDKVALFKLTKAVLTFDRKSAIEQAEDLIKSGKDISELFKSLIELFIDLAKAKLDLTFKGALVLELEDELKVLDGINHNHLLKIIDALQSSQSRLRFSLSQDLEFMMSIMSILDEDFLVSMNDLKDRIGKLEQRAGELTGNSVIARSEATKQSHSDKCHPEAKAEGSPTVMRSFVADAPQDDNLDTLWSRIVALIESNPTKTLLNQSGCYLLGLTSELMEIGLSKDMFLPRLDKDDKKKEMILKASKAASGIESKALRFRVLPQNKENNSLKTTSLSAINHDSRSGEDDFTRAIKDLLGAKQIE